MSIQNAVVYPMTSISRLEGSPMLPSCRMSPTSRLVNYRVYHVSWIRPSRAGVLSQISCMPALRSTVGNNS